MTDVFVCQCLDFVDESEELCGVFDDYATAARSWEMTYSGCSDSIGISFKKISDYATDVIADVRDVGVRRVGRIVRRRLFTTVQHF